MATGTGLGDNTELFWAILSQPACLPFCCSKGGQLVCRSEVESAIELPLNEPRYCWRAEDGVESTESEWRIFIVVGIKV
jgi:hypothetical protein